MAAALPSLKEVQSMLIILNNQMNILFMQALRYRLSNDE
jgi:hypothetical protein